MDELVVASKRVKMEVVEDENKEQVSICFKLFFIFMLRVRSFSVIILQESGKNESLIESRTECEVNVGEKDRILGMNIEVLRVKLVSQQFMLSKLLIFLGKLCSFFHPFLLILLIE